MSVSADDIDRLLPQTQCERCGYPGCRPYAEAIAAGTAGINRCPPGGEATIAALAEATAQPASPLDPECGQAVMPAVAVIDEATCIGCTRCIQACPTDAIVGAAKLMHTVIAAECTGCELCLMPCPVDCIEMVTIARPRPPMEAAAQATDNPDPVEQLRRKFLAPTERAAADYFRRRYDAHRARTERERAARDARRLERQAARDLATRRADIAAMVAAVRARRQQP